MLILKSQQFNDESLISFAASLSKKSGALEEKILHWEFGPLMTMAYETDSKNYLFSDEKVPLHWDGAFYKEPAHLLFYCTQSVGEGGETTFVNTEKLWSSLTEAEKKECKKIVLTYRTEKLAHYGGSIRVPLVQNHPVTGNRILRMAEKVETTLNPVELTIEGTSDPDGFYDEMVSKLYNKDFLYEHSWEPGDLLVCDNFTYLHGRRELGNNRARTFKRIQIL